MDDIIPISSLIHEIRGVKVMLDFDLAKLYQVETKALKQAVRRNLDRFPSDFMFELNSEEFNSLIISLRSQIVTSNTKGGTRYPPLAFSEQGVAMLSSVLRSNTAIQINIRIMRAFVEARRLAGIATEMGHELAELKARVDLIQLENEQTLGAVNDLSEDVRAEIAAINDALNELSKRVEKTESKTDERRRIGFKRDS
ncbi:MAG: ORF6N domain-containing protein [Bacteroidales bacterium]|nr:ORF6N domain-containing protein [Bacteroidales bacterium]